MDVDHLKELIEEAFDKDRAEQESLINKEIGGGNDGR